MTDSNAVRRELFLPHPREAVWEALTDRGLLAQWLHPNDFEARLGHRFTFRVPPKPEVGFEGLVVQSEVLELDPPNTLVLAWNAEDPVADTRVSFRLEDAPDGGTLLRFEHAGFNLDHPYGKHALKGAEYGWGEILGRLEQRLSNP
jgi:uncharacterized protein YndB with AHSA1/START domain